MNRYTITLRHDGGKIAIRTNASRMTQAVRQVLNYEGAPFRSIVAIKRNA